MTARRLPPSKRVMPKSVFRCIRCGDYIPVFTRPGAPICEGCHEPIPELHYCGRVKPLVIFRSHWD